MGLLGFLSEGEKLIILNGLTLGWLGFQTQLRELMHRFRLAMSLLCCFFRGREADFIKWVGCGLAAFPNRDDQVDAYIWVGFGPAEFHSRGREVDFTKWVGSWLAGFP